MAHRIFSVPFASVYPYYVAKGVKKGRTKEEVDEVIRWLTGYTQDQLEKIIISEVNFEDFYTKAPAMNPHRALIKGKICGVQVEAIQDPLMRELRYLDKLIDDLAKGWTMDKVFRKSAK